MGAPRPIRTAIALGAAGAGAVVLARRRARGGWDGSQGGPERGPLPAGAEEPRGEEPPGELALTGPPVVGSPVQDLAVEEPPVVMGPGTVSDVVDDLVSPPGDGRIEDATVVEGSAEEAARPRWDTA